MTEKVIVALSRDEIEFLAGAAHLALTQFPSHPVLTGLIQSLVEQTDYVKSDPQPYIVPSKLVSFDTPQQRWGQVVRDIDFSSLKNLIG